MPQLLHNEKYSDNTQQLCIDPLEEFKYIVDTERKPFLDERSMHFLVSTDGEDIARIMMLDDASKKILVLLRNSAKGVYTYMDINTLAIMNSNCNYMKS